MLGGGTPYFPALDERIALELVETRTFGSRVVYLRYRRVWGRPRTSYRAVDSRDPTGLHGAARAAGEQMWA